MAERVSIAPDGERRAEPKPALGVKIVVAIAAVALTLLALGVWTMVKVVAH